MLVGIIFEKPCDIGNNIVPITSNVIAAKSVKYAFIDYSTVTDLAKFLGWSTSVPLSTATW